MLKRRDARYESERTQTWLKAKCRLRQELVICGFTARGGKDGEVGSLLLGYYESSEQGSREGSALHDAGSVGTGWDARTGRDLWRRLAPLETDSAPFDIVVTKSRRWSRRAAGSARWVRPELVAEIEFAEWTADGVVRQASFKGLRVDKPARRVVREGGQTLTRAPAVSQIKVTHPERIIDPSSGVTKLDLARFYESVAAWMLPHLKDRPVAMVRAPDGIEGEQFFQKHVERTGMPGIKAHDRKLWPNHPPLLTIDTVDALMSAAQMNAVEFHTWNSTVRRLDIPDRVIFDLDPGEGVKWGHVQEAALLVNGAEQAYRKAIELSPQPFYAAYVDLGALLCELEARCDDALHVFDEALIHFPEDAVLHFNRAVAFEELGRIDDAVQSYQRCLEIDPAYADAHHNLAILLERRGDPQGLVRHLNAYRRLII